MIILTKLPLPNPNMPLEDVHFIDQLAEDFKGDRQGLVTFSLPVEAFEGRAWILQMEVRAKLGGKSRGGPGGGVDEVHWRAAEKEAVGMVQRVQAEVESLRDQLVLREDELGRVREKEWSNVL
ncbi:hypothetical protein M422DRAFT_268700 [Sphaerobolus stellatus SS14]|uniref:Uncharacterized protein n=1 Tax=Sphaerobolus stellatus (strain SS14) TaxID=990650 RepID=A0A0C9U6C7_SPHS4|nr:hypothetical protein M422DRAFT_268700 [Sphaerobolus stellatus SS14]